MIRVLFVCHGNICRSSMAKYLFQDYVNKLNKQDLFYVDSAATSYEEEGNGIYPPVYKLLKSLGIDSKDHVAKRMTRNDYEKFDYILLMDNNNLRNIKSIINDDKLNKIHLLLDYSNNPREISDPWYTRDFNKCYYDIKEGIEGFYKYLLENNKC